jgi:hypothetical protein
MTKRIIGGVAYNTETATIVAMGSSKDEDRGVTSETLLYQTRGGVFFAVEDIETKWWDSNIDEERTRNGDEWWAIGDAAKAVAFCERAKLTIVKDFAELPPEAGQGEGVAVIYVRTTPTLKAALEARAKADGVSLNALLVKCHEYCLGVGPSDLKAGRLQ